MMKQWTHSTLPLQEIFTHLLAVDTVIFKSTDPFEWEIETVTIKAMSSDFKTIQLCVMTLHCGLPAGKVILTISLVKKWLPVNFTPVWMVDTRLCTFLLLRGLHGYEAIYLTPKWQHLYVWYCTIVIETVPVTSIPATYMYVCVCVAVTAQRSRESDLGTQSNCYQEA